MDNSAKLFLEREIQEAVRTLQSRFFDIIDDIKSSDLDNFEHLKEILKDEDLAKSFLIFQENRNKFIRKKILDSFGDASRKISFSCGDFEIGYKSDMEIKGIIKEKEKE